MSEHLLGQDEIDALLNKNMEIGDLPEEEENADVVLSQDETDALGEIGNISMGAAATTLSQLLNRKVSITSPQVKVISKEELFNSFVVPHLLIEVKYILGLEGTTLLVMQLNDAALLADLMMGGDGSNPSQELTEIEISAASEAMNQMIGTAATSMATLFRRTVSISPPETKVITEAEIAEYKAPADELVAVSYFRMVVEEAMDTTIMQIIDLATAKTEAALMWNDVESLKNEEPPLEQDNSAVDVLPEREEREPAQSAPVLQKAASAAFSLNGEEKKRLDLLLDVPLKVSVVLGRTRQPIKDILNMTTGAVMALNVTVDDPVEVLLNGTLVAKGEVVVVNENFGVRITSILSAEERLQHLRK